MLCSAIFKNGICEIHETLIIANELVREIISNQFVRLVKMIIIENKNHDDSYSSYSNENNYTCHTNNKIKLSDNNNNNKNNKI